ncbi:hydroxylamine reductase [Treponema brennaborense]|uniref:Hydroxylamine reductase n=1 Tax=Treponema brennaborense (strain DSM 12168 / CIP 105900 / DD5/3) TaxID=906968 RepID=F4LNG2_TREBD|nr:hydroxylamine reductase [Treponema brennaborense]AEE17920.1 Hydroxylamine reductase [Treponema brennaborense DSM 12168]
MEGNMFCFQCEQTAGGTGCTGKAGVCGKQASTAKLQDKLTGALIGLARACGTEPVPADVNRLMLEGLFTTITNVNFNDETVQALIDRVHAKTAELVPDCGCCASPCGHNDDYDVESIWNAPVDVRSLKSLILFGIRGVAAYAYHAMVLGYADETVNQFFVKALCVLGEDSDQKELLPVVMETGKVNLACMELLDRANTETFGNPVPATVPLSIEKGPFIVISGHDLFDLKLLLEQTAGKGINVYTHGEMLPAHGYPLLKKYPHLKGNFGTAWQNQQKEFADMPAPVLFTTNCIMPVKPSYADRVFTTEVVSYPGMVHIGKDKDFSPVIKKALELGGYAENQTRTGINGGTEVTTGFGRHTVLSVAGDVVNAVKSGKITHFFLVGGCDGARPGRNYYTEFVKKTPKDSVILTLACGKYRFNDLNLGTVAGLPRLLDMGQCNDAYGAVQVALALAKAFDCGVNDLPLSLVLSWYEQKAVCILLSLLYLGIKNIYLGPTLPAFVSPDVLKFLVEQFAVSPVGTPDEDLKKILG